MKTRVCKYVATILFSMFACSMSAQSVLTLKVTNVPSAKGKVLAATDKGQYNMVDAKAGEVVLELKDVPAGECKIYVYHDENGNFQLDKEGGLPVEYCATIDWKVKEDKETVPVPLEDIRKRVKK